jgi:hypothetical protein
MSLKEYLSSTNHFRKVNDDLINRIDSGKINLSANPLYTINWFFWERLEKENQFSNYVQESCLEINLPKRNIFDGLELSKIPLQAKLKYDPGLSAKENFKKARKYSLEIKKDINLHFKRYNELKNSFSSETFYEKYSKTFLPQQ